MIVCGVEGDGVKRTIYFEEECVKLFKNGKGRKMVCGGGLEDRRQVIFVWVEAVTIQ